LIDFSEHERFIKAARQWVDSLVVDMNLCPFAKRELVSNRVRFAVTAATTEEALLTVLRDELTYLENNPATETTLLIHPCVLTDFLDYNQFLNLADGLLIQMKLEGVYQVASFHPDYQFGGTRQDDAENYTNRSPYPMLHLLREESLERAIAGYPDIEKVPQRNIERMNSIGTDRLKALLQGCLDDNGHRENVKTI
jgi:hypothetical protein